MLKLTDARHFQKLLRLFKKIRDYFALRRCFKKFKELSAKTTPRFSILWEDIFFKADDNTINTEFDAHYVYHPAWAARVIAKIKPTKHIDISSILSFSTMLSAFVPTDFYDYRPVNIRLPGWSGGRADLTRLPFDDMSIESLSCMHTIEHIGLGRYGDPIDPEGDLKAINELKRVTAIGGNLLFVVPIGKAKIMFNAHRIYSYAQIREYFKDFELKDFFLIPDNAVVDGVIYNASGKDADRQKYGCGCFWFVKKK